MGFLCAEDKTPLPVTGMFQSWLHLNSTLVFLSGQLLSTYPGEEASDQFVSHALPQLYSPLLKHFNLMMLSVFNSIALCLIVILLRFLLQPGDTAWICFKNAAENLHFKLKFKSSCSEISTGRGRKRFESKLSESS